MRTILENYPCSERIPDVRVKVSDEEQIWPSPRIPLLKGGAVAGIGDTSRDGRLDVSALLDTGNDLTIIRPDKVIELERLLNCRFPVNKSILRYDVEDAVDKWEPSYNLVFVFPGDHAYSSTLGMIAPRNFPWDIGEVWLGQEILSQLILTFDGIKGTITIVDPNK